MLPYKSPDDTPNSMYPTFHIGYTTNICSVNDAVVSADSGGEAKSLLEKYLQKHSPTPNHEMILPEERGLFVKRLSFNTDRKGILYSSFTGRGELFR